ncbi:4-hydroxy-tetrahydrodipicolinate reductase [Allosphingosinicella indica]|uniref:4-hydroxy-tetrahydrodipicolinate reductase n=1 Tax=Allosphingosinicella indica TaxID=941907 RepID=A0A1X7G084_9SPHN|nr:4-hydroxy-tetrahydrodipicolinate reductase [Allosphingosinicella indica]SMF61407.1 dihydrodipicolinate reductase [Allosphingosinicella indica]
MTAIGLFGAGGRMGQAIRAEANARGDVTIVAPDAGAVVLIDFTSPTIFDAQLAQALRASLPIVVGTTGLSSEQQTAIDEATAEIAVLESANMSLGVNLVAHLVREAAARLGPNWDIEIAEMHHRHKVDAPSGTALMLGRAAADGRKIDLDANSERGRDGNAGPREAGAIGFASLRGGSVAGEHQVIFATEGERVEIGHRAESRAIFAKGAVAAALWLKDRPAGRYTMADVLGLS